MSFALDAVTTVHGKQVDAAIKAQDLVVKVTEKLTETVRSLGGKAVPASVSSPLSTLTAPITKVLGTPADYASHVARSTHDWVAVEHRFQTAVLEAVLPSPAPVERIRSAS